MHSCIQKKDVSLAKEFQKHLSNNGRKHGVIYQVKDKNCICLSINKAHSHGAMLITKTRCSPRTNEFTILTIKNTNRTVSYRP